MEFSGKKVTVVGTGISGIGAVGLLNAVGAEVVLYDGNEKLKIEDIEKKLGTYKAEIVLGELTKELTDSSDLLVISPGVPIDSPVVKAFEAAGVPVWGAMAVAGDSINDYFDLLGNDVAHVHFVDVAADGTTHLAWGDGDRDMRADLDRLVARGYRGVVSAETYDGRYFADPAAADAQVMAEYRRAIGV